MCDVFLCPLTSCNLTEMWDKERDISIQFLDLMETDFIEIFRVKTWLLLVAISRLGWARDCCLQVTKLLHVEPHQPRPPTACARHSPARSFQYCAQLTRSQHQGKYTQPLRQKFKYSNCLPLIQ